MLWLTARQIAEKGKERLTKLEGRANEVAAIVVVVACCQQLAADDIVPESVKCATQYCVFYVLHGLFCCLLHSSEIIYQYTSVDNSMK